MIMWPRWLIYERIKIFLLRSERSLQDFAALGFLAGSVACSVSNSLSLCRVMSSDNKHVGTVSGCVCCAFLQRSFTCLFCGLLANRLWLIFVSCHVPGDVTPWLCGTRFCAESRDECLLVPACLLEFLLKDVFLCLADWILDAFWAFFLCFADWSCAQAHLGPIYFTDTIRFSDGVSD